MKNTLKNNYNQKKKIEDLFWTAVSFSGMADSRGL